MNYYIREAEITDAKAIHDIYGYYASNTYVTFTEINPSVEEYQENIRLITIPNLVKYIHDSIQILIIKKTEDTKKKQFC